MHAGGEDGGPNKQPRHRKGPRKNRPILRIIDPIHKWLPILSSFVCI